MKKIFFLFFLLITTISFSQDVITKINGDTISAKIIEVGTNTIKYKRFDNLAGPQYTILKTDVSTIKYENGTEDEFTSTTSVQEYSMKRIGIGADLFGFIQFGPTLHFEIKLVENLVLNTRVRFATLGVLSQVVYHTDYYGAPSHMSGLGVGGGLLYFFSKKQSNSFGC